MTNEQPNVGGQQDLDALRELAVEAPASTMNRLFRRTKIMQGTRLLMEKQVMSFWIVLDTVLKQLFRSGALPKGDEEEFQDTIENRGEVV